MSLEVSKKQFLHPNSPEYSYFLRAQRREYSLDNTVFGQDELEFIQGLRELIKTNPDNAYEYNSIINEKLESLRLSLVESYQSPQKKSLVSLFVNESKDVGVIPKRTRIKDLSNAETITNSTLEAMLGVHVAKFIEKQERMKPKLERIRASFLRGIRADIQAGLLPLDAEYAEKVINSVQFVLVDDLTDTFSDDVAHVRNGFYDDHLSVYVSERADGIFFEKTIYHEFFHTLAGKTLVSILNVEYDEPFLENIYSTRTGFRSTVVLDNEHGDGISKYKALNEAMTEMLAVDFYRRHHPDAVMGYYVYTDEIRQLHKMMEMLSIQCGIGYLKIYKLFAEAYFEHYDPTVRRENRLAAWKEINALLRSIGKTKYLSNFN